MINDTNATNGSTTDELMAEISQYWDNLEGSNIYELVDSFNEPTSGLSQAAQEIEDWREVKNAEGTTLDLLGQDLSTSRPTQKDDSYRFLLQLKALLSRAQGTLPSITHITSTALGANQGIQIWNTDTPHHIGIQLPWDYINDDYIQRFLLANLKHMVPLGYWVNAVHFKSTTDLPLYIGVGTQSSWETTMRSTPIWWTGWKSSTSLNSYFGIAGRYTDSSIWLTTII